MYVLYSLKSAHPLATCETWLKIHESLDDFIELNPTARAKSAAAKNQKAGVGDGRVYNMAKVIAARPELTKGGSSGVEKAKSLVRMAVYVFISLPV